MRKMSERIFGVSQDELLSSFDAATAGLLSEIPCCAAGGAFVDLLRGHALSEVDVFLLGEGGGVAGKEAAREFLASRGYAAKHESSHATLYEYGFGRPLIHAVHARPEASGGGVPDSLEEVLEGFDLSVSMAGVDARGLVVSESFAGSVSDGTVSVNMERFVFPEEAARWLATFFRCGKYLSPKKGFDRLDGSFVDFLKAASSNAGPDNVSFFHGLRDALSRIGYAAPMFDLHHSVETLSYGTPRGTATIPVFAAHSPARPWRERMKTDAEFSAGVGMFELAAERSIFMNGALMIPARAFVRSGLAFPVRILEDSPSRCSYVLDRFLNDFAFAVHILGGRFDGAYDPKIHEFREGARDMRWYLKSGIHETFATAAKDSTRRQVPLPPEILKISRIGKYEEISPADIAAANGDAGNFAAMVAAGGEVGTGTLCMINAMALDSALEPEIGGSRNETERALRAATVSMCETCAEAGLLPRPLSHSVAASPRSRRKPSGRIARGRAKDDRTSAPWRAAALSLKIPEEGASGVASVSGGAQGRRLGWRVRPLYVLSDDFRSPGESARVDGAERVVFFGEDGGFEKATLRASAVCPYRVPDTPREGEFEAAPGVFFLPEPREGDGFDVSWRADVHGRSPFTEVLPSSEVFLACVVASAGSIAGGTLPERMFDVVRTALSKAVIEEPGCFLATGRDAVSGRNLADPLVVSTMLTLASSAPMTAVFAGPRIYPTTPGEISLARFAITDERRNAERFAAFVVGLLGDSVPPGAPLRSENRVARHWGNVFGMLFDLFPNVAENVAFRSPDFDPNDGANFRHLWTSVHSPSPHAGRTLPAYSARCARSEAVLDAVGFLSRFATEKRSYLNPLFAFGVAGSVELARSLMFEEHFCDWKREEKTMYENPLSVGRNVPPVFESEFGRVIEIFAEYANPDADVFESWLGSLFSAFESLFAKMRMSYGDPGLGFPNGLSSSSEETVMTAARERFALSMFNMKQKRAVYASDNDFADVDECVFF